MTTWLLICLVAGLSNPAYPVPYRPDDHTVHLYHFDGNGQDSVANGSIELILGGGATASDSKLPGMGQALYTYEGTAATGAVLPNAGAAAAAAISALLGTNGSFTIEALVCPAFGFGSIPNNMQIVSGESDGSRGWQFRVETGGNLVFIKLTGTQQTITVPLPKDGPHAYAANKWYHVAVTYNGQPNTDGNMKFYWTSLDAGVAAAVELGSANLSASLDATATPNFVVGNEGRDFNGRTENWEGWIDEVRISDVARSPAEMIPRIVGAAAASSPVPSDKATDVVRDAVLSWASGQYAKTHDVYFGTVFDDVNTANRTSGKAVSVSRGQDANTYDPAGLLAFGQTYYWRVDEVNAAPDSTIFKGGIWSFTSETYGFPVKPVKATASSSMASAMGPDKTIDGSGLDSLDQHGTTSSQMWLSKKGVTPIWIQYEFDAVYKLYQMWVWNSNQQVEQSVGFGAKDVTVETSVDGTTWTAVPNVPQFAQASGDASYVHNTTVDFGGVQARYVKLTVATNWADGTKQAGLSEVRFFYVPVKAFSPKPASGSASVALDSVLSWRPGREAARHEVAVSSDATALSNGTAVVTTVTDHSLGLASLGLEYGRTYYWRVDEANDAATPKTWEGDVWTFSTPDYGVVDDFEAYNDTCNRIFFAWLDGFGHNGSKDCGVAPSVGNASGSTVGNTDPPFAGRTVVHGGRQSMPLAYDNTTGKATSEATRTFEPAQDWTVGGAKTLTLFFHGASDNGAGQLYVAINGVKVTYAGSVNSLAIPMWKQWNIDLAAMGVNLKAVKTLAVGVSGSGKGVVYTDDIRLYRSAPSPVQPADPGAASLAAYYRLEGDVKDGSGHGLDGVTQGAPAYVDGPSGYGQALQFDGLDDEADLPIGTLISGLTSCTVTTWVNFPGAGNGSWQRIFDFGTGATAYMFLTPRQGTSGAMRFAITTSAVTGESGVNAPATLPAGWQHVAVVIDGTAKTLQLCLDGDVVASGATNTLPKDLGKTNQNWLGRSQYTADSYFSGTLDELRIYNRVLTAGEIRYLAGDR
jgi:hypothetical protein